MSRHRRDKSRHPRGMSRHKTQSLDIPWRTTAACGGSQRKWSSRAVCPKHCAAKTSTDSAGFPHLPASKEHETTVVPWPFDQPAAMYSRKCLSHELSARLAFSPCARSRARPLGARSPGTATGVASVHSPPWTHTAPARTTMQDEATSINAQTDPQGYASEVPDEVRPASGLPSSDRSVTWRRHPAALARCWLDVFRS